MSKTKKKKVKESKIEWPIKVSYDGGYKNFYGEIHQGYWKDSLELYIYDGTEQLPEKCVFKIKMYLEEKTPQEITEVLRGHFFHKARTWDLEEMKARHTAQEASAVDHPAHYTQGKVECIDAIEAATVNLTGVEAFCTGNAIKYLWRWKAKNGQQDLDKAMWYINRIKNGNTETRSE